MIIKTTLVIVWTLALMVFPLANVSHADLMNGDFSEGLNDWTTVGDVSGAMSDTNKVARLGDAADPYVPGSLYQIAPFQAGTYSFEFDFMIPGLNPAPGDPPFSFSDLFSTTLYFVDNQDSFDLTPESADRDIWLFDLDSLDTYLYNGSIVPSEGLGTDWLHFSLLFDNINNYIIPTFELFESWDSPGDQVFIDNVSISPVPEPATLLLLGSGLFALAGMARKRRKN